MNQPLKVGDRVKWASTRGTVLEIRSDKYGVIEVRQGMKLKRVPVLLSNVQKV